MMYRNWSIPPLTRWGKLIIAASTPTLSPLLRDRPIWHAAHRRHLCDAPAGPPPRAAPAAPSTDDTAASFPNRRKRHICAAILGADTPIGENLSLMLKQNPNIGLINLQGISRKTQSLGADLNHFSTQSLVHTYYKGPGGCTSVLAGAEDAVRSADMIFLLPQNCVLQCTLGQQVMAEAPRVVEITRLCSRIAPRAILVMCVTPVSVFLPMCELLYKQTPWYHPARIVGSAAVAQLKANNVTALHLNLDPQSVSVPMLGGPDLDCCVPLLSKACPVTVIGKEAVKITNKIRENQYGTGNSQEKGHGLCEAVALDRMATAIARGLSEAPDAHESALFPTFVRSSLINICRHMVGTVKFGKYGVEHNFGIPKLIKSELKLLESTAHLLHRRELMAEEYLNCKKNEIPAFLVQEKKEAELMRGGIVRQEKSEALDQAPC